MTHPYPTDHESQPADEHCGARDCGGCTECAPPEDYRQMTLDGALAAAPRVPGLAVGRVAHYVTRRGDHLAALVTAVLDPEQGEVLLAVFHPRGKRGEVEQPVIGLRAVYSADAEPGSWHYPERVE